MFSFKRDFSPSLFYIGHLSLACPADLTDSSYMGEEGTFCQAVHKALGFVCFSCARI